LKPVDRWIEKKATQWGIEGEEILEDMVGERKKRHRGELQPVSTWYLSDEVSRELGFGRRYPPGILLS